MSRPDNLRDDPGYWLCWMLMILFPPLFIAAFIGTQWEDWQQRKHQNVLDRKCGGNHRYRYNEWWNAYPDIQCPEWSCDICRRAAPEGYAPAASGSQE